MEQRRHDSGFTLIEVIVSISLMGILAAIAISGWSSWAKAREQAGTARELESTLRSVQQRAITEGHSMCVRFDVGNNSYDVITGTDNPSGADTCDDAGDHVEGPIKTASPRVHIESPAFTRQSDDMQTAVLFTARGTAWPGHVRVTRTGSSKAYVITVEGLTGRVSLG